MLGVLVMNSTCKYERDEDNHEILKRNNEMHAWDQQNLPDWRKYIAFIFKVHAYDIKL